MSLSAHVTLHVTSTSEGVTQRLFAQVRTLCMRRDQNIFLRSGSRITLVIMT